jgi:two-component system, OmpR family, phosphate regulon sensor histidine kinase PhoR
MRQSEPSLADAPKRREWLRRSLDAVWPRTLRMRLAIPFIVLVTLVLVFLYIVVGNRARHLYVERLSDELQSQAIIAADDVGRMQASGAPLSDVAALIDALGTMTDTRLTLIDRDGRVIADSRADATTMENHNERPEVVDARRVGVGTAERSSETVDEPFLYVAVPVPVMDGAIFRVAEPLDDVYATVDAAQRYILVAIAVAIVLTIVIAWFIAGHISRPLEDLREQARTIAFGDFSARVVPSETWEIGAVGEAFNKMTAELERSLRELERTRVRLEAVLSGLVDAVVLTDEEGIVLRMNTAAEQLLETDERFAIGLPFVQVCRDHELAQVLRQALEGARSPRASVEHGLNRRILTVTARTVDGAHERLGLVVLRDVTELRRLETVRREFVANVSHELRTPLTSIRALVETLESGAIEDEAMSMEFLGRIVGEVDRLNALVEDLLDLARLEAGRSPLQLDKSDLGDVVRHGADRLRPQIERARLTMTVSVDEGLPAIEIDAKRIEQVLLNLVHNAIKFTPPEGEIAISVARDSGDLVVRVRDTGVGIADEEQARLFERFYKSDKARRSEGTGLGLAIAKHIVQLHGGDVSVESTLGEGSTFSFALPIRRKRARRRARRHALGIG